MHNADLLSPTDSTSEAWTFVDDWQLILWLAAVEAFYVFLRTSIDPADEIMQKGIKRSKNVIDGHVSFGNRILDLADSDKDSRMEVFQKMYESLKSLCEIAADYKTSI